MTTEQKIREAFEKEFPYDSEYDYLVFKKGYLALLNELEPTEYTNDSDGRQTYVLPEGVTK
jgi:hypothetical protein